MNTRRVLYLSLVRSQLFYESSTEGNEVDTNERRYASQRTSIISTPPTIKLGSVANTVSGQDVQDWPTS